MLLKAVLHYAIFRATCLTILLRCKLHEKLHGVTYPAMIKPSNIFVAASVARSRIKFYFSPRLRQRRNRVLENRHSGTAVLQLLSQRFVSSVNKNTSSSFVHEVFPVVTFKNKIAVSREFLGVQTRDLEGLGK